MSQDKKYQIFISSTYEDLKEARSKAVDAILRMYHIPIGMEMFSAADDEQWKIIRETIDTCDYYIVIVGSRYGSIAEDGISYTEKEYDYAMSQGIPVLAFVRDRNYPITPLERDDNLDAVKCFIDKIQGKLRDSWTTVEDLETKITAALYKEFQRKPRPGWLRANFDLNQISLEMASLSKENRELREQLRAYANASARQPVITVEINNGNDVIGTHVQGTSKIPLSSFPQLTYDMIPDSVAHLVSHEDIDGYNDKLPDAEKINKYNDQLEEYEQINGAFLLPVTIRNDGNIKAIDIAVWINLPNGIRFFELDDKETNQRPYIPAFPQNPIKQALNSLKPETPLDILSVVQSVSNTLSSRDALSNISARSIQNSIIGISPQYYLEDDGQTVAFQLDELLHTTQRIFDKNIYISAKAKGEYLATVSIICEEYMEQQTFEFPIVIQ